MPVIIEKLVERLHAYNDLLSESQRMIENHEGLISEAQEELATERQFYETLSTRRDELARRIAKAQKKPVSTNGQSLPSQIEIVLKENRNNMRAKEIAKGLKLHGVKTTAKKGLIPNIISALRRREDLFSNPERGLYGLIEWNNKSLTD